MRFFSIALLLVVVLSTGVFGASTFCVQLSTGNVCMNNSVLSGTKLDWSDVLNPPSIGTGNGTVTSVTAGTGLTGGVITTSGTIGLDTSYTNGLYSPLSEPLFSSNFTSKLCLINGTNCPAGLTPYTNGTGLLLDNNQFNLSLFYTDARYDLVTNPRGYYNASTLPAYPSGDNASWNQSYANTLYDGITNPRGYYNASTIPSYLTTANGTLIYNNLSTKYDASNPQGYYNVTTLPASTAGNFSQFKINASSGNQTIITNNSQVNFLAGTGMTIMLIGNNITYATSAVLQEVDPLWTANATSYALLSYVQSLRNWSAERANYVNLTTGDARYYPLTTNTLGFYNVTTLPAYPIGDNTSWNQSYANTLYDSITNPRGYYNASTAKTTVEPLWHGNSTLYLTIASYNTNAYGFYNSTNKQPEIDPLWTANYTLVCKSDGTNCPASSGDNASWNQTYANTLYYPLNTNPLSFYNASTLPASNEALWQGNSSLVYYASNNFGFYNLSTLPSFVTTTNGTLIYNNFSLYYLASNPSNYISTSGELDRLWTANQSSYLTIASYNTNAYGFYNSSTAKITVEPLWHGNSTLYLTIATYNTNAYGFYNSSTAKTSVESLWHGNSTLVAYTSALQVSSGWQNNTQQVWLTNNATNVSIDYNLGRPLLFADVNSHKVGVRDNTPTDILDVNGSIGTNTYLNLTGTGNVTYYGNGCITTSNATGVFFIC